MAKIKLPRINKATKRLASGEVRTYYYHRDTGTPLPGKPGDREFIAAYAEAEKITPKDVGNIAALIRSYIESRKFQYTKRQRPRAESTKREYLRMLTILEAKFGKMPIKALESPRVNGVLIAYHEEIAEDRPREADNRMTVLSAVFSEAMRRGTIRRNPLERFERAYSSDRSEIIWSEADIRKFMTGAPVELQRALILAIHTGQRYGDLIRLRWSDYDGETISLKQSKTKEPVRVHCSEALRLMLDSAPKVGPFILTREDGRPWFTEGSDKELSKRWRVRMAEAGFYAKPFEELSKAKKAEQLHFNDLRGTAVTLLAAAGVAIPQICAVTGHTLQSATRILEKYMARTAAMSKAAILAFENSPATAFANRLQTGSNPLPERKKKTKGNQ